MTKQLLALCCLLCFLATPAFALKQKKKNGNPGQEEKDVSVQVPRGGLDVTGRLAEEPPPSLTILELGVSSWSPKQFSRSTYAHTSSDFQAGSVPFLSLNRLAQLATYPGNGAGLFWVAGVSFGTLERTTNVTAMGATFPASQSLTLSTLRLGLEYQGPRFFGQLVEPYTGLAVLPTYELSTQTQLEDRVSAFGVMYEATGGILIRPPFLHNLWTFADGTFGLGAHFLFGSIDGSNVQGLGLQGTFSVTL